MKRAIYAILVISGALAFGCEGAIDGISPGGESELVGSDSPGQGSGSSTNPDDPSGGTTNPGEEEETVRPAFPLERDAVRLLPFHVRVEKLSSVVGVPADDPIFDALWRARYDLGDHNYGQGIGPDLSWNASKMSLWVRTLLPVCNSQAMMAKYPALPEHVNELLVAAYGREATEEDLALVDEVLADVTLSEAERYQAICLTILTSAEFVAQ